jgi:aspartate oxidase
VSASSGIPARLAAPEPTWTASADVVVLGSGAAGLSAALAARPVRDVLIITKDTLASGSTAWAQGGLAAVLDPGDSIENHVQDTLEAGAGLCDESAVRTLVTEAPVAIRYLMRLGASFDPGSDGSVALTREGGHSHNRIVHAGGDQSGAEVQRTLDESVQFARVRTVEHAFALDLVTGTDARGNRAVAGVTVAMLDENGGVESVGTVHARAVVIATGGYGQVYASTSNPPAVTGDGIALAIRAGLPVADLEFVQFHPTVLWRGPDATGQQALISEAVRGEGAFLVDAAGRRVMRGVHPQEDLAPRDVVAGCAWHRQVRRPFPHDHRLVSRRRHRSTARAHPCGTGGALRVRRHPRRSRRCHHVAGSLCRRRGSVHRCARCEQARLEQPHRGCRGGHQGGSFARVGAAARDSASGCVGP